MAEPQFTKRKALDQQVVALHAEGLSVDAIAKRLEVSTRKSGRRCGARAPR
jgi:transposase